MKRVLLIDDHSIVRRAMRNLLTEKYLNIQVDECSSGQGAMELVSLYSYDLLIADLIIPQTNTDEMLETIMTNWPGSRILLFSMLPENVFAGKYFQMGVLGFLSKESADKEIEIAVDLVLNNKKYMSIALANRLANTHLPNWSQNPFEDLTEREKQVTRLLINGRSVTEIRYILNIQNSTVGSHKYKIFEKMHVTNVIDLQQMAKLYHFT